MFIGSPQANTGAFMSKKWKIVFAISLICNLGIVYVSYKALDYRNHVNYFLRKYIDTSNELSGRLVFHEENLKLRSCDPGPQSGCLSRHPGGLEVGSGARFSRI